MTEETRSATVFISPALGPWKVLRPGRSWGPSLCGVNNWHGVQSSVVCCFPSSWAHCAHHPIAPWVPLCCSYVHARTKCIKKIIKFLNHFQKGGTENLGSENLLLKIGLFWFWPVEDHSSIITDVQRPHIQSRDLWVPVQILLDLQHRNVTRKCSSALQTKDTFLIQINIIDESKATKHEK